MYCDNNLRLSNAQAITASSISTNTVDMGSPIRDIFAGREMRFHFGIGGTFTSGGSTTLDIRVLAATRPITIQFASSVTVTDGGGSAPGVFTLANHGMLTGTEVTLGGTVPTGLTATSVVYYVIVQSANTFTLASSLANAEAGTGINTNGTGSSVTVSPYTITLASTGAMAKSLLNSATTPFQVELKVNSLIGRNYTGTWPLPGGAAGAGSLRYLAAYYVVASGPFTAGTITADLVMDVQDGRKFYPTRITVA